MPKLSSSSGLSASQAMAESGSIELSEEAYSSLLGDIKTRIRTAQCEALKAVNTQLVGLYWDIGRMIVERQQGQTWGKAVVERLAHDLRSSEGGLGGFSARNLWHMRDFFLHYDGKEKLQPLVAEIAWSHNLVILQSCRDDFERMFYLGLTRKFGWSKRTLQEKIESKTYQRTLANQTNFEAVLNAPASDDLQLALKDSYTLDFLGLQDEHSERELEQAIMANIGPFLKEMGGVFAFVGSQYPVTVGGEQFYIDLLLFHRTLRALVAIELKRGPFKPEYVGKMQFYCAILNDFVRQPGEHPTIGVVLCKSRNKMIVEYALRESKTPVGVATYHVTSALPEEIAEHLPSQQQLEILVRGV